MSDNLFDRLFELLQSPGPVNWKLAHEVLGSVAGPRDVVEPDLAEEYQELALAAELRAANTPGVDVITGVGLHPVDAATWAEENEQSFRFLFEPLAERLGGTIGGADALGPVMASLGPALIGLQAGTLVGLMSREALGQFDAGLPALDHDRRYLVVPNVEAFATSAGLDVRQVRLWAATREVVHHAVISVDWLRAHVVSTVTGFFSSLELNPTHLMDRLNEIQDPSAIQDMLGESAGLPALLGGEPDPVLQERITALLAFIDGFGRWAAGKALASVAPQVDEIERRSRARHHEPTQAEQALLQLAGIRLDGGRVDAAADFCVEVVRRWGDDALASSWQSADNLPSLGELEDPVGWAARVLIGDELG